MQQQVNIIKFIEYIVVWTVQFENRTTQSKSSLKMGIKHDWILNIPSKLKTSSAYWTSAAVLQAWLVHAPTNYVRKIVGSDAFILSERFFVQTIL